MRAYDHSAACRNLFRLLDNLYPLLPQLPDHLGIVDNGAQGIHLFSFPEQAVHHLHRAVYSKGKTPRFLLSEFSTFFLQ